MNDLEIYEDFGTEAPPSHGIPQPEAAERPTITDVANNTADKVQWAYLGDKKWQGCGLTNKTIRPAVYSVRYDDYRKPVFQEIGVVTDALFRLPDAATDYVLDLIERFWDSKEKFQMRGYLFKRGIMLCGAPGGGKTSIIQLLAKQFIDKGGVVLFAEHPEPTLDGLRMLRAIEPERPLICVLEDLDELTVHHGEAKWLALLDGESQINNVVYLATTNYPKRLDRRFINRPSRFDEIVVVQMPTAAARQKYLEIKSNGDLSPTEIERWVNDTEGMSVAHLREMYIAVFCLDAEYETVLARLKAMQRGKYKDADEQFEVAGLSANHRND